MFINVEPVPVTHNRERRKECFMDKHQPLTAEVIHNAVTRAVSKATDISGGPRLLPFTGAELRFIEQVIVQSLTDVLTDDRE